jgi:hypothetical protein
LFGNYDEGRRCVAEFQVEDRARVASRVLDGADTLVDSHGQFSPVRFLIRPADEVLVNPASRHCETKLSTARRRSDYTARPTVRPLRRD